ncbi:hypothetical protein BIFBRE_03631 [Bifidobacterium breve DSM 20213 = JCM 1192]|uniref:Uncharacterized protein n=1 Tax=Bifidobacterium breve DSM 20213 = JCM 1192 TaxID=518634 RepID=D4BNI1_BIFBR|nr:hypothetical protein BIFBRE_03631 [Bifidobacterium breve DSM 20213 = JCM 1192]
MLVLPFFVSFLYRNMKSFRMLSNEDVNRSYLDPKAVDNQGRTRS